MSLPENQAMLQRSDTQRLRGGQPNRAQAQVYSYKVRANPQSVMYGWCPKDMMHVKQLSRASGKLFRQRQKIYFSRWSKKRGKANRLKQVAVKYIGGSIEAKLLYLWMRAHGLKTKKRLWFLGLMQRLKGMFANFTLKWSLRQVGFRMPAQINSCRK